MRREVTKPFMVAVGVVLLSSAVGMAQAAAADSCTFDSAAAEVNIAVSGPGPFVGDNEVSVGGDGSILWEFSPCGEATVFNTDTIVATGTEGVDDFYIGGPGRFRPGATSEGSGSSEIEFVVDMGGGSRDLIGVLGTGGRDTVFMGRNGIAFNTDGDPEVQVQRTENYNVIGGRGADVLSARGGQGAGKPLTRYHAIWGDGGKDRIMGGAVGGFLRGGAGNDVIVGSPKRDVMRGDAGRDTLRGRGGKDRILGGGGEDKLLGGAANDRLRGLGGNDLLRGGPGDDNLNGGPGVDTCFQGPGSGPVRSCEKPSSGGGGGGGGGGNCHPSYPDVCIPPPPPDLDCNDIPFRNFRVRGSDPHNFDGDGDGVGCET